MIYAHSTERWFLHVMDGCMRAHTRRTGYTLAVEDDEGSWRVPKAFTRDTEPFCHSFFFFFSFYFSWKGGKSYCAQEAMSEGGPDWIPRIPMFTKNIGLDCVFLVGGLVRSARNTCGETVQPLLDVRNWC